MCGTITMHSRMEGVTGMRGDFFRGIEQQELELRGRKVKMPVFYYDNTSLAAFFTASTDRVRKLLPHRKMRPMELRPGRCLVVFSAFEYRKSDLDPYNEFAISVGVTFGKTPVPLATLSAQFLRRSLSACIWQLPVTTEIARAGGVDFYGYPKFIADIDFHREPGELRCTLAEKGADILSLSGKVLPAGPGKVIEYTTFSIKDGTPLQTRILVNPVEFAQTMSRDAARLEIASAHPLCRELKSMELGEKPVLYQYSPVTEAVLFAGTAVAWSSLEEKEGVR